MARRLKENGSSDSIVFVSARLSQECFANASGSLGADWMLT
jgi:hypothetical protein